MKDFKSEAEAKKEYDKLVAEKVKKGYQPSEGGGGDAEDDDEDEDEAPVVAKKTAKPAAKPAKAAPAPKVAAKPAAAKGTAPRYFEFSEGTSNKFWEITMTGNSVRTRYGKIGTGGQQTQKDFGDKAAAQKEYDKLVHEKTKKGYEEKDGAGDSGDEDGDED